LTEVASQSQSSIRPVSRRPRCPAFVEINSAEDLMPYLEAVAKRKYVQGALHAAWDLHEGERVLLKADTWHDPMVLEACRELFTRYAVDYEVEVEDRGPVPELNGHDEVEMFLMLTKSIAQDMDRWAQLDAEHIYDKVMWGLGGPVMTESNMKITRMPFITPEILASPAHTMPIEILSAIDEWTDRACKNARKVRVTDPEGTDISYTLPDVYFNEDRTQWNGPMTAKWWPQNPEPMKRFTGGHITARPYFLLEQPGIDDVSGVIAGTMNHVGPYPRIELTLDNCKITKIEGGGLFGDKLRDLDEKTKDVQYPGYPGPGLMWFWEVAIGTNPKIHRPRANFLTGWVCGVSERMRSGVIHLGFGTIITTAPEREAALAGELTGHWHVHLYFPTVTVETVDGDTVKIIDEGRLRALDAPEVRAVAEQVAGADADYWLQEDWIPAIPGINCGGSYDSYAKDPTSWTKTELEICRNYHPLFMRMVDAEPAPGRGSCH
jgi:hypothetical protein